MQENGYPIEKIKSLEIPWYHYVNGHDLTSCLGGLFQENDFRYSYFKKMARKKIKYSHVESHPLFQAIEHWRQSQGFPTFFIGS